MTFDEETLDVALYGVADKFVGLTETEEARRMLQREIVEPSLRHKIRIPLSDGIAVVNLPQRVSRADAVKLAALIDVLAGAT